MIRNLLEVKFGRKTLLFWSLALTGKNHRLSSDTKNSADSLAPLELYFLGITYFGSEMILLMTEEGEEPTEVILQSSRWMAFAGKFFISGSFSVSISTTRWRFDH